MADKPDGWGLCKDCKWWQIEPDASVQDLTLGVCIEKQLQDYELRISGLGGCNRFQAGEPTFAAGASEAPPQMATDIH
ncbi:hypothetical protein NG895_03005 [Aeoliella sp. ICT_H6.2]|uniref:Uncharacterized protein n=1 Tax=Aeoliella straminimaris TaxID=2954799 RepID=A0A9X2JFX1_9BACT|nr:hypothetical protein [Aeoliella straminimaris]MCO6042868.1 hypothetical protein [Aeoliella straminimaris]